MNSALTLQQVITLLDSEDSAQKTNAISAARNYICLPHSEEGKAQLKTTSREDRIRIATLPRRVFKCMYSADEEVVQEAAFVLVASSNSHNEQYRQCQRLADLEMSQLDFFIEHLEAFLSSFKVHVVVESQLLFSREDEKNYFVVATFKIFDCMPYRVGGKKVRLKGLPKQSDDDLLVITNWPLATLVDSSVVEPSADEKESGVQYKCVANLSVVKEFYDSGEDNDIRIRIAFNGLSTGSCMKIEGLPEKVPA